MICIRLKNPQIDEYPNRNVLVWDGGAQRNAEYECTGTADKCGDRVAAAEAVALDAWSDDSD
jgi:hypothetical protein